MVGAHADAPDRAKMVHAVRISCLFISMAAVWVWGGKKVMQARQEEVCCVGYDVVVVVVVQLMNNENENLACWSH